MSVTIKFQGAQGSGKTTLAEAVERMINEALGGPRQKAFKMQRLDDVDEIVVDLSDEDIRILRSLS